MILVFGGTTEGRACVKTLDEAGSSFFYSTRGSEQQIESKYGKRLTGAMDREAMLSFCRQNQIRLLVDAAHPFASQLQKGFLLGDKRFLSRQTLRTLHFLW